jgi:glutamine amidotransferase
MSLKKIDYCAGMSYIDNNNEIPAIIYKDNFIGTQFHPEKSQKEGLQLLANWCKKV